MTSHHKDPTFLKAVADTLRELRESKGLSAQAVSEALDLDLASIESGREDIELCTLSFICRHYGLSIDEFFDCPAFR